MRQVAARRGVKETRDINGVGRPTPAKSALDFSGENRDSTNPEIAENRHSKNESAEAAATALGAKDHGKAVNSDFNCTPKKVPSAMAKFAKDTHKRAARVVGYALTLGDADAWADAALFFSLRLSEDERAGIAWAGLRSLSSDRAEEIAALTYRSTGMPMPTFLDPMAEAEFWTQRASKRERKAFLFYTFHSLPAKDRAAFLASPATRARA